MPVSLASTLPNSSPVASRSVGFCDGVRTRCSPSAARAARGVATISERVHSARSPRVRAIIGGECTIAAQAMSVPRLFWLLLFVAASAGGVYMADRLVLAPGRAHQRELAERDAQIRALTARNQALEAAVRLLRHTERRARLVVLDQAPGPEGHPRTRVRFTELDSQGDPVGEPREMTLEGDEVYVDTLVVKFEDDFVTAGDALKGKALLLFRRIFSDRRRPAEGEVLDREGQIPQSYAAERAPTAFERELWARFWELANDPGEAKKRGVRALHGEAVSTRLRKDRVYSITLRSTGELTIQPIR